MTEASIANRSIVVVFPDGKDKAALIDIFSRSDWKLHFAQTFSETLEALSAFPGVVISQVRFADGNCWNGVLDEMQKMAFPPPLIVADRLADENLWAEVLSRGAYDLLAMPFDAKEVLNAVHTACRRNEQNLEMTLHRKPAAFVKNGAMSGSNVRAAAGR